MKKVLFFLTCLWMSMLAYPQISFERTYGGLYSDIGNSVIQTLDNAYIVVGSQANNYTGVDPHVSLFKTNIYGDTLWSKSYHKFYGSGGYSVVQTYDSGYIIMGYTNTNLLAFNNIAYLIKTLPNGDTIWTKTFDVQVWSKSSVVQTNDSGYVFTGYKSISSTNRNATIFKIDANGSFLWEKNYGGAKREEGRSLCKNTDGGFTIVGFTTSFSPAPNRTTTDDISVYLIRTDANGDTLWTKTYGGDTIDYGLSVAQTNDGGFIIAGGTFSFGNGYEDVYLIRTNANGDTIWTKTYGGSLMDEGVSVLQTDDGGFIVTGQTSSLGAGYSDVYLIRTNSSGNLLWTKTFGGTDDDGGWSIAKTADGGFIIAGYTLSYGAGGGDFYLIKTDANGIVGIKEELFSANNLLSIYPNPAHQSATLQFNNPQNENFTLALFNTCGQLVREISNITTDKVILERQDLTNGIYFFRLSAESKVVVTGKMIME
jgi:hypothetical protein